MQSYFAERLSAYREMRQRRVVRDEIHDAWLVAQYADVSSLLRSPTVSSRAKARAPFRRGSLALELFDGQLESIDAPLHTRLRRSFHSMLGPSFRETVRAHVDATAEILIDRASAKASLEVVSEVAQPMSSMVMARCLGLDDDEFRPFRADVGVFVDCVRKGTLSAIDEDGAEEASSRVLRVARKIVDRAASTAPVAALCSEALASGATLPEVAGNCLLFVGAGQGPTRDLIATGLYTLLQNPEHLARLADEPSLIPAAVEEALRYDSPLQIIRRKTAVPVVVGETAIPADETMFLVIGAANHDDRVYDAPDEFRLSRGDNHHLAFGLARHTCLGATIARLCAESIFRRAVRKRSEIRLLEQPQRYVSLSFSGLTRLLCAGF